MFFKGSRYEKVADDGLTVGGREIRFKRMRFIAETKPLARHVVREGERLDMIAHHYYRNPELFWRIADANRATQPGELTSEAGRAIGVPGSEG